MRTIVIAASIVIAVVAAVQFSARAPSTTEVKREPQAAEVTRQQNASIRNVPQPRGPQLEGSVTDPQGRSVSAAKVFAWLARDDGDDLCGVRDNSPAAVTSDHGQFTLDLNAEQLYCVQAEHPQWAASAPLMIASDDAGSSSANLVLNVARVVSGSVVGITREQINGVTLVWKRSGNDLTRSATVDAQGAFTVSGLDTGAYTLRSGDARYIVEQPQEVVVGEMPIADLEVRMYAAAMISGTVRTRTGDPAVGARVQLYAPYAPDQSLGVATTGKDGSFSVQSAHLSEGAENMRRMFAGEEGFEGRPIKQVSGRASAAMCMTVTHPKWGRRDLSIARTATDLGLLQLDGAVDGVSGRVLNHRDEETRSVLMFRRVGDQVTSECSGFSPLEVQTDAKGRFDAQLPPAQYEVEIKSDRYLPQTLVVDLESQRSGITLKLK